MLKSIGDFFMQPTRYENDIYLNLRSFNNWFDHINTWKWNEIINTKIGFVKVNVWYHLKNYQ